MRCFLYFESNFNKCTGEWLSLTLRTNSKDKFNWYRIPWWWHSRTAETYRSSSVVCTFQCMQVWSDRLDHYSALRPTYLSKQQANPNDFLLPLRTCSLLLMTYQRKADVWRSACMVTRNFNMPKLGNALSASHSVRNKPNEEFRVELSSVCFSKPSLLHLCICRYCRMSAIAQKAARCGVVWRGVAWRGVLLQQSLDQHLVVTQTNIQQTQHLFIKKITAATCFESH